MSIGDSRYRADVDLHLSMCQGKGEWHILSDRCTDQM